MSHIIDPKNNPLIEPKAKIIPEDQTRKKILARAKYMGCDVEVKQIIDRYDTLLKNCTNEQERQQIAYLGVCAISKYMDCTSLTIDGNLIYDDTDYEKEQNKR